MAMFKLSKEQLRYEHVHRHFLRTRKLRYEPGTNGDLSAQERYSNHGFGLWTLIIQQLSGKAYWPYVRDEYLKPLEVQNDVLPEREIPDGRDAWNHAYDSDNKAVPRAFEQWGLGLAAGGFRSSAENLARLMASLMGQYSIGELTDMGWGNSTGVLGHSGLTVGGTAYVRMYPQGYAAPSGVDMGHLHVALVTNIRAPEAANLRNLVDSIAAAFTVAGVSNSYDLWP